MARPRHSVTIRILALALLLWVGFDVGAHGFLASDFAPLAAGASAARVNAAANHGAAPAAHDHCFCHGIYESAVALAVAETLVPAGGVVPGVSSQAPRADGRQLDRPPQLIG